MHGPAIRIKKGKKLYHSADVVQAVLILYQLSHLFLQRPLLPKVGTNSVF